MTWSVAHTATYSLSTGSLSSQSTPWRYHFETFLPSRGWTVRRCDGTEGYVWLDHANEDAFQCHKQFTNFDGTTFDHYSVYEFEYNVGDLNVYEANSDYTTLTTRYADPTWDAYESGNKTAYWLVSDQDDDAWIFIMGGLMKGMNLGVSGYWFAPTWSQYPALVGENMYMSAGGNFIYAGFPNSAQSNSFLMTNMWLQHFGSTSSIFAHNTLADTYHRINGVTVTYTQPNINSAASALIGGRYYLDLNPSKPQGLMLDMDQTNLGILSV